MYYVFRYMHSAMEVIAPEHDAPPPKGSHFSFKGLQNVVYCFVQNYGDLHMRVGGVSAGGCIPL